MKPRAVALMAALIALTACDSKTHATSEGRGGSAVENSTLTKLGLTSSAFSEGQAIPVQHTCDGANQSPPLSWGDPPQGTKSFALIVDDPDAPSGTFRHWGAYDIPASTRSIAEGQHLGTQAMNDMGKAGYGGPCPPRGHGVHHYHFKLFALDVEKLGAPANAKVLDVENEVAKHAIGRGELIGTYERR